MRSREGEPRSPNDTRRPGWGERPFTASELDEMRRTRRHPRPTQFDYLHMKTLVDDLRSTLVRIGPGARDVLDLFCGTRPYDDLLQRDARIVSLDVPGNPYGIADVVTSEFLPFPDGSFDLVMCIEAFHYVRDPAHGVSEIARVLRPGGYAIVAVPFVWQYDRTQLEHRFTGPALEALFEGWEDVSVVENGGRAVSWATLTASLAQMVEWHVPDRSAATRVLRSTFSVAYLALNAVGLGLDALERRFARSSLTLPMNLLVSARRP